jgi:hypothetical protein
MFIRQALQLTSLCSLVNAHGYLSKPMSRTGLNAEVPKQPPLLLLLLTTVGWPRYMSRMHHSRTRHRLARP